MSISEAIEFLNYLKALLVESHSASMSETFGEVFTLARQFDLSSYDALYLHLALSETLPMATLDEKLKKAASVCGVSLLL